ncbi:MAG: DJ-1/PfpI family protein [Polyangiaceae bacterium]|nr:DJ-1/PfpI family protein [Polyangiaceae bacterium]
MTRAFVLLIEGFEEIEAVTVADVLDRAKIPVELVGVETHEVVGAHKITLRARMLLSELTLRATDLVVLPGGMPGATSLRDHVGVQQLLRNAADVGATLAAICAAPIALEAAGLLNGKHATSFPGFRLPSAHYSEERVVEDGNVVTSRAPGTALEFALALVARCCGPERAATLAADMLVFVPPR